MPAYLLGEELVFPPREWTTPEGVLAVGGDLRPERLLLAYRRGIFPWPVADYPLLWFCPDPRFVLPLDAPGRDVHLGRSLRKVVRRERFAVTFDESFGEVLAACAEVPRPGQDGTWITDEIREGYLRLHELGFAHSVETRDPASGALLGGLYGVSLGDVFFGESMFARAPDASKVAFTMLLGQLVRWGVRLVDCQQETEHLARFGARAWPRERFLATLDRDVQRPTRQGKWRLETNAEEALATLAALDAQPKSTA